MHKTIPVVEIDLIYAPPETGADLKFYCGFHENKIRCIFYALIDCKNRIIHMVNRIMALYAVFYKFYFGVAY